MKISRQALAMILAFGLAANGAGAMAATWEMDPAASTLGFTGSQTGKAFNGQFRRFTAQIVLDPADLSNASISATIDINSFASGSADRDTDAVNSDWFHASAFPQATFTSNTVTHVEGNAYLATGTLAIKGVEREIELPFTLDIDGDQAIANGTIVLDRMDYQVGVGGEIEDDHFVGHAVTINLHIEATKAD